MPEILQHYKEVYIYALKRNCMSVCYQLSQRYELKYNLRLSSLSIVCICEIYGLESENNCKLTTR